jgi:hypothetical protein
MSAIPIIRRTYFFVNFWIAYLFKFAHIQNGVSTEIRSFGGIKKNRMSKISWQCPMNLKIFLSTPRHNRSYKTYCSDICIHYLLALCHAFHSTVFIVYFCLIMKVVVLPGSRSTYWETWESSVLNSVVKYNFLSMKSKYFVKILQMYV